MSPSSSGKSGAERRRWERVDISYEAGVRVSDPKGNLLGTLRQIARGGMMLEPEKPFKPRKKYKLLVSDEDEKVRFQVNALCHYDNGRFAGFEFVDLDPDSAVDVGVLMGKYYGLETKR